VVTSISVPLVFRVPFDPHRFLGRLVQPLFRFLLKGDFAQERNYSIYLIADVLQAVMALGLLLAPLLEEPAD